MRRADRLFRIVQFLRTRRLTTAAWLAERLDVSTRTVYRDIADLALTGIPIEGEPGVGYVLRHKLDLPPLMFDRPEAAAVELGLRFVGSYAGRPLAGAAASAMAKVRSAMPKRDVADAAPVALYVPKRSLRPSMPDHLFEAIEARYKVRVRYEAADRRVTERVIWPLGAFFWGPSWTVLGWCELRQDFRTFRVERIRNLRRLEDRYPDEPGRRLEDYFRWMQKAHAVPLSDFDPL